MPNTGFDFTTQTATGFDAQIELIQETWGVALDAPRPEERIQQRMEAWNEWVESVPRPDFGSIFLHAPADEWDKLVEAELDKEKHWRVVANTADLNQEFARQRRALRSNGAEFDWILEQLDVEKMAASFTKSAKALDGINDLDTALDAKPQQALALRKTGRALAALVKLVPGEAGLDAGELRKFAELRTCAVLARPTRTFEPLERHRYTSGFQRTEDTWEPDEYDAQVEAKAAARPKDISSFLVDLARGNVPHFELAPATSINEVRQRQRELDTIGKIIDVDKGFGKAETEEDRQRARARQAQNANKSLTRTRKLDPDA